MYYMLFSCGAILLLSIMIGFRRGLLGSLLRVVAFVIGIVATFVLAPMVTELLIENTDIDERINQKILTNIESGIHSEVAKSLEDSGVKTEDIAKLAAEETKKIIDSATDKASQMELIKNLQVPDVLKNMLIENNNDETYNWLDADGFYNYVSGYTTYTVMKVIGVFVTFVAIMLVLIIICIILGMLVKEVPIIAGVNRLGGMILGAAVGMAIIWFFMAIASVAIHQSYSNMIGDNPILLWLDQNNIFTKIIMDIKLK